MVFVKTTTNQIISYNNSEYELLNANNSNMSGTPQVSQIADNFFSSTRTRSVIEPDFVYDTFPQLNQVPMEMKMDFTRILNKPFFIQNINWVNTAPQGSILSTISVPTALLNNSLAAIPFLASVLYRCKLTLLLQVAGTPMHQGIVIASSFPNGIMTNTTNATVNFRQINSFMAAPHVFMAANESTAVALEVPFYVNGKLDKTDIKNDTISPYFYGVNYANVMLMVLNPLSPPSSGTSTVSISVHAMFTEMEFFIPHTSLTFTAQGLVSDLSVAATKGIDGVFSVGRSLTGDIFDVLRRGVRTLTGLHNPNIPAIAEKDYVQDRQLANVVDKPVFFEKLDPYCGYDRIVRDYIFDTKIDEMDMRHLLKKPQYLGTFVVNTSDTSGTICWIRPITPIQQMSPITYPDFFAATSGDTVTSCFFNNIPQILAKISRYWRGSIKIHLQSNMTNFHFCKLLVARDYSPVYESFTGIPTFSSVQNLLTETLEFSAGGQVQTLEMPFCSPLNQLPCANDWRFNAGQHGLYYIYLAQPLVFNGTVASNISFNVYISCGDDFQFSGYAVDPVGLMYDQTIALSPVNNGIHLDSPFPNTLIPEPPIPDFVAQAEVSTVVNDQEALLNKDVSPSQLYNLTEHRPIVNIRDYARRLYRVYSQQLDGNIIRAGDGLVIESVSALIGFRAAQHQGGGPGLVLPASTIDVLSQLFYGYHGGVRLKIIAHGAMNCMVWYVPPNTELHALSNGDVVWSGANPVPVGGMSTANQRKIRYLFSSFKDDPGLVSGSPGLYDFSSQTVLQEQPNYSRSGVDSYVTAVPHTYQSEMSMFDVEIPYMSPMSFIGDTNKYKVQDLNQTGINNQIFGRNTAASDLGFLIIYIPPTTPTATTFSNIDLQMFVSVDDTARYGYQISTPTLVNLGVKDDTGLSIQIGTNWGPSPLAFPPGPVTAPNASLTTNCYRTKTS